MLGWVRIGEFRMRWVLAIVALWRSSQDENQQVDNILFTVPKGWKRVDREGVRSLVPVHLDKDRTVGIFMCMGEEPTLAFRPWFDKNWETVCKEQNVEKILSERAVESTQAFGAAQGLAMTAAL